MEILHQSRPVSSASYSYVLYLLSPSGDLLRLSSWSNYWKALDAFKREQKRDKSLKFVLIGSECDNFN